LRAVARSFTHQGATGYLPPTPPSSFLSTLSGRSALHPLPPAEPDCFEAMATSRLVSQGRSRGNGKSTVTCPGSASVATGSVSRLEGGHCSGRGVRSLGPDRASWSRLSQRTQERQNAATRTDPHGGRRHAHVTRLAASGTLVRAGLSARSPGPNGAADASHRCATPPLAGPHGSAPSCRPDIGPAAARHLGTGSAMSTQTHQRPAAHHLRGVAPEAGIDDGHSLTATATFPHATGSALERDLPR